ncbi:MAG: hypothetical protein DMC60_10885 [Verrucomicrobia bacterium]|nr:MAG: hypothetical protein DMC60_10885 [Verrucomicrobiota bacterium]
MHRISGAGAGAKNYFQVYFIYAQINRAFHGARQCSNFRFGTAAFAGSLVDDDYRIGSLSGEIDKLIARTPDLEKDEIKVWLLKAR